ncbi:hypothetical protein HL653_09990 [Sphingomonas sp. AP4-R1]|uniref:hypothetical protein n=1 Tax=Sphingomonas sp. AP4-R1 TaxID=2735134 RepID=UPI0014936445|nr:hypothetical protein [Sphingomonas sp. AP4-R1]QJU58087.1 hypothetical protein HL653_09990 [Sphingomonas sp. AP4-R1]
MANGYDGGGAIGGKWGCALSAALGVPLIAGAVVLSAYGECAEGVACHQGLNWRLLAGGALAAIGLGFGTLLLVNVTFRRLRMLAAQEKRDGEN